MKCKNCGNELRSESKFCTSCGHPVETESREVPVVNQQPDSNNQSGLRFSKALPILFLILTLGVIYWYIDFNVNHTQTKAVLSEDLSGDYYDPTGVILGSAQQTITIIKSGNMFTGFSEHNNVSFSIEPIESNKYKATVTINNIPAEFVVQYIIKTKRLEFVNHEKKWSWYLKKK